MTILAPTDEHFEFQDVQTIGDGEAHGPEWPNGRRPWWEEEHSWLDFLPKPPASAVPYDPAGKAATDRLHDMLRDDTPAPDLDDWGEADPSMLAPEHSDPDAIL